MQGSFFHVESVGAVKGSILTQNHSEAMKFYNDCKEQKSTVVFTVMSEKQADEYKAGIEKEATNALLGLSNNTPLSTEGLQ